MQLSSVVKVTQVQYIFKLRENKIKMSCEKTKSRSHVRKQINISCEKTKSRFHVRKQN